MADLVAELEAQIAAKKLEAHELKRGGHYAEAGVVTFGQIPTLEAKLDALKRGGS